MNATSECREFMLAKIAPLEAEALQLIARQNEIGEEIDNIRVEIDKIRGSIARLDEQPKKVCEKPKQKAKVIDPNVRHVKKPDIEAVCSGFVRDNPNIDASILKELAEDKLVRELKFPRKGVGLGINRWLIANGMSQAISQLESSNALAATARVER